MSFFNVPNEYSPEPVYWPVRINDYASKYYVDTQVARSGLFFDSPLSLDGVTKHVSIADATSTSSGIVSSGTQSFGGNKTFSGKVYVGTPGSDTEAANKKYVDDAVSGISDSFASPLQRDPGTRVVTILAASLTDPGVITTGDQSIAGNKTFQDSVFVRSPTGLSSNMLAANIGYVNDQISAASLTASSPLSIVSNVISMTAAAEGVSGYVNSSAQSFSGVKAFLDGATSLTRSLHDSTLNVATTEFVSTAAAGAGFSAGNGWISGCFIDRVPTLYPKPQPYPDPMTQPTTAFHISPGKVRFTIANTDATAASPTITKVIDLFQPSGYDGTSLFPEANSVAIYVDIDGNVTQLGTPTDTAQMYDKIQLGTLLQTQVYVSPTLRVTFVFDIANVKLPIANNYDITMCEFINYITPINLGPMKVTASPTVSTDYSIYCGGGYFWGQMTNLMPTAAVTNRTNPSTTYVPPVDRPNMYGFWQYDGSTYHAEPVSNQIDTARYNPNATGDLVDIPDVTPWVNIPVMYQSAIGLFAWQYPTDAYGTEASALAAAGKFTRLTSSPQFRLFNVIGEITVHKYDVGLGYTDFSNAFFGGGEFFNYGVGGSSGASGGGASSATFQQSNTAWVDQQFGSDTSGNWTFSNKPFLTYDYPAAQIGDASSQKPYVVLFAPGTHSLTSLHADPYINLSADAEKSAQIACSTDVTLGASWSIVADASVSISDMSFINGTSVNFDLFNNFSSTTCASSIFVANVTMSPLLSPLTVGTLTYRGRPYGAAPATRDSATMREMSVDANVVLDGGTMLIMNCQQGESYNTTVSAANVNTTIIFHAVQLGNLTVNAPAAGVTLYVLINSCIIKGTLNVVSGATINVDRASVMTPNVGSGTVTMYDNQLTQDQVNALSVPNVANALSAANPVIERTGLTATLLGYVPTSTTVNGHALTTNVVVQGGDLPSLGSGGTQIDHSLLNITSADLPNPAAISVTGTAYNLASGQSPDPVLPSNVRANTAATSDNSTLIATNQYVHSYVNFAGAGGAAQLDGTGKVPTSQLPASVLGAMQYKGTFNADSGAYPVTPPYTDYKGWYYICAAGHGGTVNDGINTITYNPADWATCDGTQFDKVDNQNAAAYVSTWTGSTNLVTLGTIATGTWNADVISSSKGGAGTVTGILKADGAGNVSAASHITGGDYISPTDSTSISGVKTFTSGLISSQTFTTDENDTYVATTAFVHNNANVPQNNVIFVSSAGSDSNSGRTLNMAVLTFAQAVTNCTGHSSTTPYTIRCMDAEINTENITLGSYISVYAPNMTFKGNMSLADNCFVTVCCMMAAGTYSTITYSSTSTDIASFRANTMKNVLVSVTAASSSPSYRYLDVDQLEIYNGSTGLTCGQNCTLYVKSRRITGPINSTSSNAVVDLTEVGDVSGATITATAPGVVKYPNSGASAVFGIVKCDSKGGFSAASAPSDYIVGTQVMNLNGPDVTGTGTIATGLSATISSNVVTFAKMQQLNSPSVLGSFSASSGTPANITQLSLASAATSATIPYRDASANIVANNFNAAYAQVTSTSNQYLFSYSAQVQEFTATGSGQWCMLPNCVLSSGGSVPIIVGFKFTIINSSVTNALQVVYYTVSSPPYSGGQVLTTVQPLSNVNVFCTAASTSAGTWYAVNNSNITVTGAVTGSGSSTISTSFSNSALTSLATGYVLGNVSGSSAAPAAVAAQSSRVSGTNTVALRDGTTNNVEANAFVQNFATGTASSVVMTGASAPVQEYTGSSTATYQLPVIGTASGQVAVGYTCTILNNSAYTVTVNNSGGGTIATMPVGTVYDFRAKVSANTWVFYRSDYNQNTITISGVVTGSGTTSITTSYPSFAAYSVLANMTGSSAVPTVTAAQSTAGAGTLVMRDASTGSIGANALMQAFNTGTTGVTMTGASAPVQEYTGTSTATYQLPVIGTGTTTVPVGYVCVIINNSSYTVTVNSSNPTLITTMAAGTIYAFVAKTASATWLYYQTNYTYTNPTITISGVVTGSGTTSITTSYPSFAAYSVLANMTGSSAAPTATAAQSTAGAGTLVMRDVNTGSVAANAMMQGFNTGTAGVTMTGASAPVQEYTGSTTATYQLPVIGAGGTNVPVGYTCKILNNSSYTVTVNSSTPALVTTVAAGTAYTFVAKTAAATWIYYQTNYTYTNPTITVSGAVTGSGTTAITTSFANSVLGTMSSGYVLGNVSGSSAAPAAVSAQSTRGTNTVALRDATTGNIEVNAVLQNFSSTSATTVAMYNYTSPLLQYTGTADSTFTLPAIGSSAGQVSAGYMCKITNSSAYNVIVKNSVATTILTIVAGATYNFIARGSPADWIFYRTDYTQSTITISGAVTGSGTTSITTSYPAFAAYSVLANMTGSSAAPTATTAQSTAGAGTLVMRDGTTGNIGANAMMQSFNTSTAGVTMTGSSAPIQEYTGTSAATYQLPVIGSGGTNVPVGYVCVIINNSSYSLTINDSGASLKATALAGTTYTFVAKAAATTWAYYQTNPTITLSGVVTGSGTTAITTSYPNFDPYTVLANVSSSSARPSPTVAQWGPTIGALVIRDALCGNSYFNAIGTAFNTGTVGVVISGQQAPVQEFTGTSTVTYTLPTIGEQPGGGNKVKVGYQVTIINNGTVPVIINNAYAIQIGTVPEGMVYRFVAKADTPVWLFYRVNPNSGYTTNTTNLTLTAFSQSFVETTGSSPTTVTLPVTNSVGQGAKTGITFTIFNNSSALVTVNDGASSLVTTIAAGLAYVFVARNTVNSWVYYQTNYTPVTLSGAVTGTGTGAITTAYGAIAANSVMANNTGSSAVPTAMTLATAATATSVVARDSNANTRLNSVICNIAPSNTSATVLTAASAAYQRFTGITTAVTLTLPDATSLPVGTTFTVINDSAPSGTSTGAVNVVTPASSTSFICTVTPTLRAVLILAVNGSQAGTWTYHYYSNIPPQLYLPSVLTSGSYYFTGATTLTAAQCYAGIISGSGTFAFTFPTAANFFSGMSAIIAGGTAASAVSVPVGFNFTLQIYNAGTGTLSLAAGGATLYGSSLSNSTQYYSLQLHFWVTSATTYAVLNSRDY